MMHAVDDPAATDLSHVDCHETAGAGFSGVKLGTQHINKQAQNVHGVINCACAQASPVQSICKQPAVVRQKEAKAVEIRRTSRW